MTVLRDRGVSFGAVLLELLVVSILPGSICVCDVSDVSMYL